jgi:hypothetical protein
MTSYPKIFRAMQDSDEAWHRRETREAVCEALSVVEDRLEMNPRREGVRAAIRGVRRALEAELWS